MFSKIRQISRARTSVYSEMKEASLKKDNDNSQLTRREFLAGSITGVCGMGFLGFTYPHSAAVSLNDDKALKVIRLSSQEKQVSLSSENTTAKIDDFVTIAAHLFRGAYYPGSLDGVDYKTSFMIRYSKNTLYFDLDMEEPNIKTILKNLQKEKASDFFETDFVCLNFLSVHGLVIQAAVKPDGSSLYLKNFQNFNEFKLTSTVKTFKDRWTASLKVPLKELGYTHKDFMKIPIPFDIVRLHCANSALTAWCSIPDQLPFNENYDYPVFCFGLLTRRPVQWEEYKDSNDFGLIAYEGPRRIKAGDYVKFKLHFTVGKHGMKVGGGLRFRLMHELMESNFRKERLIRHFPEKDWTPLQWESPKSPGYISVSCSRKDTQFVLRRKKYFSIEALLAKGKALQEGDRITIAFGHGDACPGVKAQWINERKYPLKIYYDILGNGVFLSPPEFPCVDIIGREARRILVHCQPTPDIGEKVRLVITAIDDLGNIAQDYRRTVSLNTDAQTQGLPSTYSFSTTDNGSAELSIKFQSKGVYTIQAIDTKDHYINGTSNLILTDGSFGPEKIFFGEPHQHSWLSDGRLYPEDKYREMIYHRGLDFGALTDHDHDITSERLKKLNDSCDKFNIKGRFATLFAYEWTGTMGQTNKAWARKKYSHRNVFFKTPIREIQSALSPESDTPQKLIAILSKKMGDVVCISHFHGGGDSSVFPGVDDAVEISGWCAKNVRETQPNRNTSPGYSVQDILSQGHRVGIVAGSDHGTEPYYTGLPAEITAVYARELSRDAVFEALKDGRCYGTSGHKVLLRFSVNDQEPSNSRKPVKAKERTVKIIAGSAIPVVSVEVIKNGKSVKTWNGSLLGMDQYFVKVKTFTYQDNTQDKGYYYARIRTAQGHTTWSSPVFYDTDMP